MNSIDKEFVKKSFNASAGTYDRHAGLQEELATQLVELVDSRPGELARLLDIGMGTGNLTVRLGAAYPHARVYGCDLAFNMIARGLEKLAPAPRLYTAADAEHLPFAGSAFDLVASGFTYQWLETWDRALGEVLRVLRPEGLFIFSAFGARTFRELRQAFTDACRETGYEAGAALSLPLTEERIQTTIAAAGFVQVSGSSYCRELFYPSVNELVRAIKGMGARNASSHRSRSPGVRRVWRRMVQLYEQRHAGPSGIPATFEIIMGNARSPKEPPVAP